MLAPGLPGPPTRMRASDSARSLVGRVVGDFEIEAVIGGGSFGTVYRGRQLGLDRPVAIKVPSHDIAADPIHAKRFAREARAAARIVHPGVVAIYAVGELDDGRPYLAMQLIDGEPLDRVLEDGPVPPLRALGIARDIASALSETHAAGVVHRDLKPTNIMWRRDRNGDDRITLVDFGIAVCRPGNADAARLTTHGLIGTPHYMSPEQAQGEQVDPRSDLYALGCLLFELVTGDPPFDGTGMEVLLAHLGHPTPRASERNPAVPAAIDEIIARLMAKKPDDRPASADDVVVLIDEAIDRLAEPAAQSANQADSRPRTRATSSARSARRAGSLSPATDAFSPYLGTSGAHRDAVALSSDPHRRAWGAPARTAHAIATEQTRAPRTRWRLGAAAAIATLAVVALSGAGYAALRLRGDVDADDEPSEVEPGRARSSTGEALRLIARDDGELIVRTLVPETIHAGVPVHGHLEITTKLGAELAAKQVVITVEDPHHNATAQTAAMHGARSGHYAFRHTFAEPGPYIIRIFPSETQTVSTIELDVVP